MCKVIKFSSTEKIKKSRKKSPFALPVPLQGLLLSPLQSGHIRNIRTTVVTLPGHDENSSTFQVKCMILVLLIHWQRQITTWYSGYQALDLVKTRSYGWESKAWEYFSTLVKLWCLCCLPQWMLRFSCAGDKAQVFADACYSYICCWTQPESHSSLNQTWPM